MRTISEETFLKRLVGKDLDMEVVAVEASRVRGEIGQTAREFLQSMRKFDKMLKKLGFEENTCSNPSESSS